MKKLLALLTAAVATLTSAWAATWSNLDSTEAKATHFTQYNNNARVKLSATEECPAGSLVAISEICFASPSSKSWLDTITINGSTGTKTTSTPAIDETYNTYVIYTFETPAKVVVGSEMPIEVAGSAGNQVSAVHADGPILLTLTGWGGYTAFCSVTGEPVTAINYTATVDAEGTLTWEGGNAPTEETISIANITINGEGRVSSLAGAPLGITIGEGVELVVDDIASTTIISGAGVCVYKSNFPSVIPGGHTVIFEGASEGEAVSATTANAGTLKTKGLIALSGSSSGTLEVVSGTTTLAYAENSKAISGNVTIDQGATMVVSNTDSLNYDGSATVKVYGTLDLGSSRWSMGANNKLFVYGTGTVAGAGQVKDDAEQGALDYYTNDNHLVLVGNATVSATVRIRNTGHSLLLAQTRDSTVRFSGKIIGAGNVIKGAASNAEGGTGAAGNAFIEFSGENTFTGTFTHKSSCGTLRFMPGCSMAASSITTEPGTALSFGSAVAEGEVTIAGSVTYNNGSYANEPQVYVNTSIGGAFTSNKRVKVYGNKTLTLGEGSEIELTNDSTGTIDGTGTIKWPVAGNPGITVASTWTGIFSVKALSGSNLQMQKWITANSTLQTTGYTDGNAYINGGNSFSFGTLELLEGGTFTLNNGNSNANYTFAKVCGSGTFDAMMTTHNGKTPGAMTFNITTLDANIAVNCNRTLKVTTVVTTLEEQPTAKTKVVSLGADTTIANIATTAFKLADGETALEGTITTEGEGEDYGVYVTPASTGPTTWEEVTTADLAETDLVGISSEGLTALKTWAQGTGNVAIDDIASINVNCFLMDVANSSTDPELKITAEDLATILSATDLATATAEIAKKYPNAKVVVKDVTESICGAGAENTHLYQLELSLPMAE